MVRYLVECGANIDMINLEGETPLTLACEKRNGNIIECLVEHSANINNEVDNGETLLFTACMLL